MKIRFFLLLPIVLIVSNILTLKGQWLDATSNNDPYTANDIGFFQSKTGVSFNINSQGGADYRHTSDGGQTWAPLAINNISRLSVISPVNTTTGFAGGRQLAITTNGGLTWDSVSKISFVGLSRAQVLFQTLVFPTTTVGFATLAGNGNVIYKTTDGGKSWTTANRASGTISSLYAYDSKNVYAIIGDTAISYTNNGGGGTTWNTISFSAFNFTKVYSVLFINANEIYITGASGNLFHTTNAGTTWKDIQMDTAVDLFGIQFFNGKDAIISGGAEVTFATTDSGKTWYHRYKHDPKSSFVFDLKKTYYFDQNSGAALGKTGTENALLYDTLVHAGINNAKGIFIHLDIYPNPSAGIVNINTGPMEGSGLLTIFNISGKMLVRQNIEGNSKKTLSLGGYGKGVYIIEIATANNVGHRQVIIE